MTPRKQRDYKAEYAARQERAKSRGFRSYGQERRAREAIKSELTRQREMGMPAPEINVRTKEGREQMALFERAYQVAREKGLTGERDSDKRLPRELVNEIRARFTDPETGELDPGFYPAMRALYPKKGRSGA